MAVESMGRFSTCLETGTHDSVLEAIQFISKLERRQGMKVACPEEIANRASWNCATDVERQAQPILKSDYGQYMTQVLRARCPDSWSPRTAPLCR